MYYAFGMQWDGAWMYDEPIDTEENRYRYNGKEYSKGSRLSDYGARYYSSDIGRWNGVDPLAQKYSHMSPFAFVDNNSISNREIDGRWFEKGSKKTADKIESKAASQANKLDNRAAKLESKGKDAGDLRERADELWKSVDDIKEMRKHEDVMYMYAFSSSNPNGSGNPEITGIGTEVVTMYVGSDMQSRLHESRHGGDVARGELKKGNHNINHEISAYRAQYSWAGNYSYRPADYFNSKPQLITGDFQTFGASTIPEISISNIKDINASMVRNIGEIRSKNGILGWGRLYPKL